MVPRRPGRRSVIRAGLGLLAAPLALALPSSSLAAGLDDDERRRLAAGDLVRRHLDVDLAAGSYFGGVAYTIVHASPAEVMAAISDPDAYRAILPLLREGRVIGKQGDDLLVYFSHGGRVYSSGYVAIVRRESPGLIRFWLDPSRPHDVADCWGYFRAQPYGPDTLLTYGALLRLDFGFIKAFFSEKIRKYALDSPLLIRSYDEAKRR